MKFILASLLLGLFTTGCATTAFNGQAHVSKAYCQKFCQDNGFHLTGMVALGEYSSGCVCSATRGAASIDALNSSGAGAGAVGVVTQMRAQQQQAAAAAAAHHPYH